MKLTGQMLREKREELKLTLSEISMSTKINQKILKAIEDGDVDRLPAKTFLRGFVQAYAIALKLDVNDVMKSFFDEMGTTTPEVAEAEDVSAQVISGRTLPSSMESSTATKVLAVAGIVVLILLVLGVKSLVEKYENEGRVEPVPETLSSLPPPAADEKAGEKSPAATAEVAAAAEEDAPEVPATPPAPESPAPAAEEPATPPPAPVPTPTAKPEPIVVAVPPTLPTTTPAAVTPAPTPAPPAPAAKPEPAAAQQVAAPTPAPGTGSTAHSKEIILEALDRIEVAIKINNGTIKKVVLQPDEVYTIKGSGRVSLDLSDGGAVNLIVNGQDRGVPGDLGKPRKVDIP